MVVSGVGSGVISGVAWTVPRISKDGVPGSGEHGLLGEVSMGEHGVPGGLSTEYLEW